MRMRDGRSRGRPSQPPFYVEAVSPLSHLAFTGDSVEFGIYFLHKRRVRRGGAEVLVGYLCVIPGGVLRTETDGRATGVVSRRRSLFWHERFDRYVLGRRARVVRQVGRGRGRVVRRRGL